MISVIFVLQFLKSRLINIIMKYSNKGIRDSKEKTRLDIEVACSDEWLHE